MFERFTERARKVVVLAQEEARSFGHAYIGTEHLLLGLLREDRGIAAHALGRLDVTLSGAREQLESIVGHGEDRDFAQAPFTPRSKKVLELALRESMQLGHNYIGTEHILLGLVREREGVAYKILSNLGVEADEVYEQVIWLLGDEPSKSRAGARREAGPRGSARHRCRWNWITRTRRRRRGRPFWGPWIPAISAKASPVCSRGRSSCS
jgi:ATP-dependent Clp protease ATP-binding subunit ClpC